MKGGGSAGCGWKADEGDWDLVIFLKVHENRRQLDFEVQERHCCGDGPV
jgi:hypothetical protein